MFLLSLVIFALASGTLAEVPAPSPTLFAKLPIASQAPPTARIGVPFVFTLSPFTFAVAPLPDLDTIPTLIYTVALPAWATFNPETLAISGVPPPGAPDAFPARVAAAFAFPSATNSASPTMTTLSASSDFSLHVVTPSAPAVELDVPLEKQLHEGGSAQVSGGTLLPAHSPPGVRVPPGWSFSIGMDPHTFKTRDGALLYYTAGLASTLIDSDISNPTTPLTALPSWLTFSPAALTFSGVAPTFSVPCSYNIVLAASTVQDAQDAADAFVLLVADADGELEGPPVANASDVPVLPPLLATSGTRSSWSLVQDAGLYIDGRPLRQNDVATVIVDLSGTSWMHWDADSLTLSGTPPSIEAIPAVFMAPVYVTSKSDSTVSAALPIRVYDSPFGFTAPFPRVLVSPGTQFTWRVPLTDEMEFDIAFARTALQSVGSSRLPSPPALTLNASLPSEASWLAFDPESRKLWGTPPSHYVDRSSGSSHKTTTAGEIIVVLTASRLILASVPPFEDASKSDEDDVGYPAATRTLVSNAEVTLVLMNASANDQDSGINRRNRRILEIVLPLVVVVLALLTWRFRRHLPAGNVPSKAEPDNGNSMNPPSELPMPQENFEIFGGTRRSTFFGCVGLSPSTTRAEVSHTDYEGDSSTANLVPEAGKEGTSPQGGGRPVFASERAGTLNYGAAAMSQEEGPPRTPPRRLALMRMFRSLSLPRIGVDIEQAAATTKISPSFPELSSSSFSSSSSSGLLHTDFESPRSPPSVPRRRADFRPGGTGRRISDGIGRSLVQVDVQKVPQELEPQESATSSALSCEDIIAEYADVEDATYHHARVVPVTTTPVPRVLPSSSIPSSARMRAVLARESTPGRIGVGVEADDVFSAQPIGLPRSERLPQRQTFHGREAAADQADDSDQLRIPSFAESTPVRQGGLLTTPKSTLRRSTIRLVTPPSSIYGGKPRVTTPEIIKKGPSESLARLALELERASSSSQWIDLHRA